MRILGFRLFFELERYPKQYRWNAQVFANLDFLKRRVKMHPFEMNNAVEKAKELFDSFLEDRFQERKMLLNLPSPAKEVVL